MKTFYDLCIGLIIISLIIPAPYALADVSQNLDRTAPGGGDGEFTYIAPNRVEGAGEFFHGSMHGKLLMRTMILGAVPTQGIHYFPEGTDLLNALLYAGGYGESTKLNGITIRRRNIKELIDVDLENLIEEGEPIPMLADGDVVQVPFNWRQDITTISTITGFISSMTAFTLSIIALTK